MDNALIDELYQFVAFANIFKDDEPDDISTELFLHRLIMSKCAQATFSNVEIALRIYLVLMVANCSGERSFSKLKLIKNPLRTSMVQDRLVNLAIMSRESDVMGDLDLSAIIEEFRGQILDDCTVPNCQTVFALCVVLDIGFSLRVNFRDVYFRSIC